MGIGASAGGLAAFEAFFSGMPADSDMGMAFVLIQHLAPDHESILTELIRRYTRMQVFEVEDGIAVRPNCIYIIPPSRNMALMNGSLQLFEPAPGQRLPIDFFFKSLAQELHERAVCIVLSGTGCDGTLGIRSIKGEGGMAMAQTPESAEFDGMPRNAIMTGLVDYQLPPNKMPAQLTDYMYRTFSKHLNHVITTSGIESEIELKKIFILLRNKTGHDFSQYKKNTIDRRIQRRMVVNQIKTLREYVQYLQQTPVEIDLLFKELLIGVTSFFRDPKAFKVLEKNVIPKLFDGKPAGTTIRIWSPACSTGEEAYSIAILLQEQLELLKQTYNIQIFATDIDQNAISIARAGLYPASIGADILPERLSRFFVSEDNGRAYRIHKNIRDMMIFSEQDIIKDPPFSKIDLISCRNLLIYMSSDLQKKLVPLFHYALNPQGILFLGTSESLSGFDYLFTVLDPKSKLYQRNEKQCAPMSHLYTPMPVPLNVPHLQYTSKPSLREITEQALLQQVVPACSLVDEHGDILYIHGRTGKYLEPSPGTSEINNIIKMSREGLRCELTTALHKAKLNNETVYSRGLRVKTNGDFTIFNLTVCPVPQSSDVTSPKSLYLVILDEVTPLELEQINKSMQSVAFTDHNDVDARIIVLKQKLQSQDEYLQTINSELQTANEDLKSSNEEMRSVNEELQSTNEELQTSKEELQSVNEELSTVNTELQTKVDDLSQANNDINNLLAGTGIATVFVDHQLRIMRFTPAAAQIIKLIPSDKGRPIGHIASNLIDYDNLEADILTVLDTLISKAADIQSVSGNWYSMRINPYRTVGNVIEGAVISFLDITKAKKLAEKLHITNDKLRMAVVVNDANDAITAYDLDGNIMAWNPAAEKIYGWSEAEALSMNISNLVPKNLRTKMLAKTCQLSQDKILKLFNTQRITKDGTVIKVQVTASALINKSGKMYAVSTTERVV